LFYLVVAARISETMSTPSNVRLCHSLAARIDDIAAALLAASACGTPTAALCRT
jgi:hypothetical protein